MLFLGTITIFLTQDLISCKPPLRGKVWFKHQIDAQQQFLVWNPSRKGVWINCYLQIVFSLHQETPFPRRLLLLQSICSFYQPNYFTLFPTVIQCLNDYSTAVWFADQNCAVCVTIVVAYECKTLFFPIDIESTSNNNNSCFFFLRSVLHPLTVKAHQWSSENNENRSSANDIHSRSPDEKKTLSCLSFTAGMKQHPRKIFTKPPLILAESRRPWDEQKRDQTAREEEDESLQITGRSVNTQAWSSSCLYFCGLHFNISINKSQDTECCRWMGETHKRCGTKRTIEGKRDKNVKEKSLNSWSETTDFFSSIFFPHSKQFWPAVVTASSLLADICTAFLTSV